VKRHAPLYTPKRDNGLVGEDRVWPLCVECQIEEGDVGDLFMVGTRGIESSHFGSLFGEGISRVTGWPKPGGARVDPQLGGTWPTHEAPPPGMMQTQTEQTGYRLIKDGNFELLHEWNTVEVPWQGDKAAHIVNGRTVNVVTSLQQPDPQNPGKYIPLHAGKSPSRSSMQRSGSGGLKLNPWFNYWPGKEAGLRKDLYNRRGRWTETKAGTAVGIPSNCLYNGRSAVGMSVNVRRSNCARSRPTIAIKNAFTAMAAATRILKNARYSKTRLSASRRGHYVDDSRAAGHVPLDFL